MSPAYIDCVKTRLSELRNSGEIRPALVRPTRAGIRKECLLLLKKRLAEKKDYQIVADFFEHNGGPNNLSETINDTDLQDLKALQKFLLGETEKPNYKIVEMTAWLVDFQPRPYDPTFDYSKILPSESAEEKKPGSNKVEKKEMENGGEISKEKVPTEKPISKEKHNKWKIAAIASAMTLFLGFGGYAVFEKWNGNGIKQGSQCMFWAGDHYEEGECIKRGGDSVLKEYDLTLLRNFRRITDTSLITVHSIGRVWYKIIKDDWEFYTADGKHPIDGKNLRRLTEKSYKTYRESVQKKNRAKNQNKSFLKEDRTSNQSPIPHAASNTLLISRCGCIAFPFW